MKAITLFETKKNVTFEEDQITIDEINDSKGAPLILWSNLMTYIGCVSR